MSFHYFKKNHVKLHTLFFPLTSSGLTFMLLIQLWESLPFSLVLTGVSSMYVKQLQGREKEREIELNTETETMQQRWFMLRMLV